ncbi:MAG: hypothetical protein SOW84_08895 [Candidatus Faecousia sp.]|nr:hypothetical protein [Candidatus Faecousia sp.]
MNEKTKKLLHAGFYVLIFAFLYLWFSKIHALVVFDGDDWTYLAYVRSATPVWGEWNPAKVFPEVVFPFVSTIAAHVLTPLTGDYITAQTIMHAFVVSLFITGYLWCFSRLLRRCFPLSRLTASLLTVLFLAFHFLAMRSQQWGNQYLLYCVDLNCYYNYLLPSLLNASLVMCLIANGNLQTFLESGAPAARGCFYVVVYLAIFSNLPSSGILTVYAGCVLLLGLIRRIRQRNWSRFFPENAFSFGVLAAWLVSAVFELSGGRAASAAGEIPLPYRLYLSCKHLARAILECNRIFLLVVFGVTAVVCLLLLKKKEGAARRSMTPCVALVIGLAVFSLYTVALCAVVNPDCISRSEYLFGIFFYGVLLSMLALAFLLSRYPRIQLVFPLLVLFLVSQVDTRGDTFLESNFAQVSPSVCAEVSRNLVQQLQEADQDGLTEAVLRIPVHVADPETQDNWPHSLFLMERIPGTLRAHGLISRNIAVTPVADPAMNAQFHLPVPTK